MDQHSGAPVRGAFNSLIAMMKRPVMHMLISTTVHREYVS